MKIIHLCKSVYPYVVGGVEVYVHNLVKQLEENKHENRIVVTKQEVAQANSQVIPAANTKAILEILGHEYYDCLHIHSLGSLGILQLGVVLLFNRFKKRRPVIIEPHGSFNSVIYEYYGVSLRYLLQRLYVFYLRKLSALVDCFIVVSHHQRDLWTKLGFPPEKVTVLPPFVDLDVNLTEELHVDQNNKSILYAGRLSKEKGIDVLITALPYVLQNVSNVELHIAGDGALKKGLIDLARKLGVQSHVVFDGHIPHERMAEIYRKSDVFVLPSTCAEGFPLSILEAMNYGLPVITTGIGGQAELVKQGFNGELVRPGDSKDLAEKISVLLRCPDLAEALGKNAKVFGREFGPQEHTKKLERIYERASVL